MERAVIVIALVTAVLAVGCKKPAAGPKTTEVAAVDRPVSELMPAASTTETTTAAPDVKPSAYAAADPPAVTEKARETYVVRKGDTLWAIATRLYGSGKRYRDIVRFNHIADPSKIYAGQVLQIPQ